MHPSPSTNILVACWMPFKGLCRVGAEAINFFFCNIFEELDGLKTRLSIRLLMVDSNVHDFDGGEGVDALEFLVPQDGAKRVRSSNRNDDYDYADNSDDSDVEVEEEDGSKKKKKKPNNAPLEVHEVRRIIELTGTHNWWACRRKEVTRARDLVRKIFHEEFPETKLSDSRLKKTMEQVLMDWNSFRSSKATGNPTFLYQDCAPILDRLYKSYSLAMEQANKVEEKKQRDAARKNANQVVREETLKKMDASANGTSPSISSSTPSRATPDTEPRRRGRGVEADFMDAEKKKADAKLVQAEADKIAAEAKLKMADVELLRINKDFELRQKELEIKRAESEAAIKNQQSIMEVMKQLIMEKNLQEK